MKTTRRRQHALLLTVCYLAQMVIGTSQPFGLHAMQLLPVLAAGTLTQLLLYRWLQHKTFCRSRLFCGALAVFFCLMAGYDFVRADRFYRAVTEQQYSFWWLTGCMLLLGWYAAACGRHTVLRAALPVLAGMGLSLGVLALTCSLQPQNLLPHTQAAPDIGRMLQVYLQYTFGGEVLLWYYWSAHPTAPEETDTPAPAVAGWQGAVLARFVIMVVFVLLAQMTLGPRFTNMPQVFGVLSLVSGGRDAAHGGALWHCVWLMALALRVCAICCTLKELCRTLLPAWPPVRRLLILGAALCGGALLWTVFWQQDCLTALAAGCALLTGIALCCKRKGAAHASQKT